MFLYFWAHRDLPLKPYRLGLAGGIASGKTHISTYLQEVGAVVIDCDKLGHQAYLPETKAYQSIIDTFGIEVVDGRNGNVVNRKVLGSKVFSDKALLHKLNAIVWPAIAELVGQHIEQNRDAKVVVIDAAVMLEAGWDSFVHEIWVPFVPAKEAVRRIVVRNQLTEEAAWERVRSQFDIPHRINKANVVFCSLWDYDVTKAQVIRAWNDLMQRI